MMYPLLCHLIKSHCRRPILPLASRQIPGLNKTLSLKSKAGTVVVFCLFVFLLLQYDSSLDKGFLAVKKQAFQSFFIRYIYSLKNCFKGSQGHSLSYVNINILLN